MSGMHADLHIDQRDDLIVQSTEFPATSDRGVPFVCVTVGTINVKVKLFIKDLATIDRLAFEFGNLSRTLRESGMFNTSKENNQ